MSFIHEPNLKTKILEFFITNSLGISKMWSAFIVLSILPAIIRVSYRFLFQTTYVARARVRVNVTNNFEVLRRFSSRLATVMFRGKFVIPPPLEFFTGIW